VLKAFVALVSGSVDFKKVKEVNHAQNGEDGKTP
jgi:hypothetical protein